ncbi:CHAB-LIKE1 [Rachiplusia nu nucleopolyhedrovirus]|uniref:CHAB-LIKE1 n=1 Tax=Rachiplusia nu nucleopolyhedrovirus TaxID=2605775 RepID=A0AAF1DB52_9ABAC|nr:CHAB-LIKE1 [Rachiplusia nu nucleopolyhedrovirus]QEI03662.1 CHAB-LIKE1 [Rachiplusia nu nucleopolyhedrovirus]
MFNVSQTFYKENMPAKARRLFDRTFNTYHKLDGGDEEIALHLARQAVERDYIKLNDQWIPKAAFDEIVRHTIIDSEEEDEEDLAQAQIAQLRQQHLQDVLKTQSEQADDRAVNQSSARSPYMPPVTAAAKMSASTTNAQADEETPLLSDDAEESSGSELDDFTDTDNDDIYDDDEDDDETFIVRPQ